MVSSRNRAGYGGRLQGRLVNGLDGGGHGDCWLMIVGMGRDRLKTLLMRVIRGRLCFELVVRNVGVC